MKKDYLYLLSSILFILSAVLNVIEDKGASLSVVLPAISGLFFLIYFIFRIKKSTI